MAILYIRTAYKCAPFVYFNCTMIVVALFVLLLLIGRFNIVMIINNCVI